MRPSSQEGSGFASPSPSSTRGAWGRQHPSGGDSGPRGGAQASWLSQGGAMQGGRTLASWRGARAGDATPAAQLHARSSRRGFKVMLKGPQHPPEPPHPKGRGWGPQVAAGHRIRSPAMGLGDGRRTRRARGAPERPAFPLGSPLGWRGQWRGGGTAAPCQQRKRVPPRRQDGRRLPGGGTRHPGSCRSPQTLSQGTGVTSWPVLSAAIGEDGGKSGCPHPAATGKGSAGEAAPGRAEQREAGSAGASGQRRGG